MGDAILEATARRLTAITGDGDLVARMGRRVFDRPLWRSAERHPSGGCDCRGNASTDPGWWDRKRCRRQYWRDLVAAKSALEELLADADALLYQVKGEGKDGLRFSAYGKR